MTTPGPWRVIEDHYALNHYGIAQVGKFAVVSETPQKADMESAKADAQLIAAAPDMQNALKRVDAFFISLEQNLSPIDPLRRMREKFHAPVLKVIRKAIAKSEMRG